MRKLSCAITGVASFPLAMVLAVASAIGCGDGDNISLGHIVVAEFDNQTTDSSLDLLGSRVAHWITHGLQHAAIPTTPWDFSIHSWEYVQSKAGARMSQDPIGALAEETGAGIVISGTIRSVAADTVEVRVSMLNVGRGRSLASVDPITLPRASENEIIALTQQRVMAVLVPLYDDRRDDHVASVAMGPLPRREAYQIYREGERLFAEANGVSEDAVESFRAAAGLEPGWALPLMRMHQAAIPFQYGGRRPSFDVSAALDTVRKALGEMYDILSPYERAFLNSEPGRHNVPLEQRLPALHRAAHLAPGSNAEWNLAIFLGSADRPREALDCLLTLGNQRKWVQDSTYWIYLGEAYQRLNEYERALDAARTCRERFPDEISCLAGEATALGAMGRAQEFAAVMDELRARPQVWEQPHTLIDPIEFLHASGQVDAAKREVERSLELFDSEQPGDNFTRFNHGRAQLLAGRLDEAQNTFDDLVALGFLEIETHGIRGVIAAVRGDTAVAVEELRWSERVDDERATFNCGLILGALGETDRAIEFMRQANEHGLQVTPWMTVRVELGSLRDRAEFQELMRARG